MRILCTTFNAGQDGGNARRDDYQALLAPAELQDNPADLIVVGFQEMAPLALGLIGIMEAVQDAFQRKIENVLMPWQAQAATPATSSSTEKQKADEAKPPQPGYALVGKSYYSNISMFIYAKAELADSMSLQWSSANCGLFDVMSNKGALAARLSVKKEKSDHTTNETFTFCCAHLAPHVSNVQRRNENFEAIVRRANFGSKTIYDTNHLIFFGDLNYRLSKEAVQKRDQSETFWPVDHEELRRVFTKFDQLSNERADGRTCHGLSEAPLEFKPTYKYLEGYAAKFNQHRTPAWCDRVLFASTGEIASEGYSNVMNFQSSDHRPVYSILNVTSPSDCAQVLASPFALDPYRSLRYGIGYILDMILGALWALLQIVGGGSELGGLLVVGFSALTLGLALYVG